MQLARSPKILISFAVVIFLIGLAWLVLWPSSGYADWMPSWFPMPAEDALIHTAPTGAKFLHQDTRKGLIPLLLEDLMAQRDEHKAGMAAAKANQDDKALQFHDSMQYAVKILMNSFQMKDYWSVFVLNTK